MIQIKATKDGKTTDTITTSDNEYAVKKLIELYDYIEISVGNGVAKHGRIEIDFT